MPRVDPQAPLLPSVLDRLIDNEPDVSSEPAWQREQSLRQFELGVLRDVESLLNSRQSRPDLNADFKQAAQSVLTYGLPDFTSALAGSRDDFERIRQAVEEAISHFEPRLRQVRVSLHEPDGPNDRRLQMHIEAVLWVEPDPQPIVFNTVVHTQLGTCKVEPSA